MRRFLRTAGVALVTFVLGVLLTVAWWQQFPRRVSLCTIARNPAAFDGRRVRIEVSGSVLSSPRFHENSINVFELGCSESNAWASVQLNPNFEQSREVDEFVNSHAPEIRDAKDWSA